MFLFSLQVFLLMVIYSEGSLSSPVTDGSDEVPRNISVLTESSTSLLIKWEPPSKESTDSPITGYKIKYRAKGGGSDSNKKVETVTVDGNNRREYQLADLKKGSQYAVKIAAIANNNQTWTFSDWITGETLENDIDESRAPDAPSKIRLDATATSISISWQPPKDTSIAIRGYVVGWGVGVPDDYTKILNANERFHQLTGLKPTNEYVVSVRAFNDRGDGPPIYESIWTRVSTTPEPKTPLLPPVGLRVNVLSSNSVVLHWTDSTLNSRSVPDNRFYTVRYTSNFQSNTPKYKYINTTKTNCVIDDLKPYTQYEFAVRVTKGRKETTWSMSVINATHESMPSSPPEDLTVVASKDEDPTIIHLHWQPPRQPNGQITGYVILYTTTKNSPDKAWAVEPVVGDRLTTTLKGLLPDTTYYFKIQVRNKKGYGPMSEPVAFRTLSVQKMSSSHSMIFLIASVSGVVMLLLIVVSTLLFKSRRYNNASGGDQSLSRKHKGYIAAATSPVGKTKSNKELKPPDLWIHHNEQLELKGLEKGQVGTPSVNVAPVRRNSEELPLHDPRGKNSTSYNDTYYDDVTKTQPTSPVDMSISIVSGTATARRTAKAKPIMISVDGQMNGPGKMSSGNSGFEPSTGLSRPLYPRTQFNIQRAHISLDSKDNHTNGQQHQHQQQQHQHHLYDPVASPPLHMGLASSGINTNQITTTPNVSYSSANGFNIVASPNPNTNTLTKRSVSANPLKSFSVPGPTSQNSSNLPPPIPLSTQFVSPIKKGLTNGALQLPTTSNFPMNKGPLNFDRPTAHVVNPLGRMSIADSLKREDDVLSTYSTEELNQEMANLEGLMKDLNAITSSEFEMGN